MFTEVCLEVKDNLINEGCILKERLALSNNINAPFKLILSHAGLALQWKNYRPISVNFCYETLKIRLSKINTFGIIKACKPKKHQTIIDLTAGFGKDAAILAFCGAKVLMLEQHPILAELIKHGLTNRDLLSWQKLALQFKQVDALSYLRNLSEKPDLIYLDPMHPIRQKTALVKKDMQILQKLIEVHTDAQLLLAAALKIKAKRTVIKWPKKLKPLILPNYSVGDKTVRFDVFVQ